MLLSSRPSSRSGLTAAFGAGFGRDHRGREVTWGGLGRRGIDGFGGDGGGRGAVVEVVQVQFIDKVVDVLMQLKLQQSRVHRQSAGHFSCVQRVYPQCKLCRRLFLVSTFL